MGDLDGFFYGLILIGAIIGAIVLGSIWLAFAQTEDASTTETQAIEHGAAYYHPTSGEFTWKESENGKM